MKQRGLELSLKSVYNDTNIPKGSSLVDLEENKIEESVWGDHITESFWAIVYFLVREI